MRTFAISAETGRGLLNGAPVLLRGAGVLNVVDLFEHPECGDKPWNERWVRQALRNIKEASGNAARFAFDHPPEIWYRLADEEGILVQDEAHSRIGDRVTVEALAAEFAEWIHERVNHPSVVIWDASNETPARESNGRLLAAISAVRHLDRSNRPWDNSWEPTGHAGDVTFELHPYLGWRPNYSPEHFREAATKGDWPGAHQDIAVADLKPGFIINEYCGVMLMADGSPSQLAQKFFDNFMSAGATAADRFLARARFVAMETEYWRRVPGVLGVMWNPYLHGSGRHVIGDLEQPALEPLFARFVRDASAPTSVMVDFWNYRVEPGATIPVVVSIANDSAAPWSGPVHLHLLRAGRNVAKRNALFASPVDAKSLEKETVSSQTESLGPVSVSRQATVKFTISVPAHPGNYQLMAEITGPDGAIVRSWRDFMVMQGQP